LDFSIMNQINTIVSAYKNFLNAGASYGAALRDAAKALKGKPCPELMQGLATVHAEHFGCKVSWSAKGSAQFFTGAEYSRDARHETARVSWQRNVTVHFKTETESFKAEVDPVAKMIKAMEKLTPAQRRKVLAAFA
jgi:hypothetical protein